MADDSFQNLGEMVLATAERYGDAVAFGIRRGLRAERMSYREVALQSSRVASWLEAGGVRPGDRVAVWAPNMPEYAVLYFGAWMAGVAVVPLDVRTQQSVVDRFAEVARPRIGFRSRFLPGEFRAPVAESYALEDLLDLVAETPPTRMPEIGPEAVAEIAFTSGTTGVPKGVVLSHGNFLAEVRALRQAFPLRPSFRALSLLPLSHALEQSINLLHAFSSGVRITYVPRVNAVTIGRALREDRITCLVLVPQLLRLILNGIERRARDQGQWRSWQLAHQLAPRLPLALRRLLFHRVHEALGGELRFFGCGGAPLDVKLASAWERMGVRVFEGYGLTETAAASALNTWSAQRLGTVGRPLPGVQIRIAEDGEILIKGPAVTHGYYRDTELTERAFLDGWFRTGDVGSLDADGFLRISGRDALKIVLPDGRNVYPEDVERALNQHPMVRESCVVAVQRDGGEVVHAALLTAEPEHADEIVRQTNRGLASQQQIAGYTVWREDDFPRTPILKIDRKAVRAAVERQATSQVDDAPQDQGESPSDPLLAIVHRVATRRIVGLNEDAELEADLGLDSIGRVELLSAVEEEMGRVVDETAVGPQTTASQLRSLIAQGSPSAAMVRRPRWMRAGWARAVGHALLWAAFRLQDRWMRIEVVHPERAQALPMPCILIFNYQGPYPALLLFRALPRRLRERVAVAMDSRLWEGSARWQGILAALAVQGFAFVKSGGAVRESLEETGRWLDDGYAVMVSPEGNPERNGELLPFLGGIGLMAVEMRVPVVPVRIEDYHALFPERQLFPYLPIRKGPVRVVFGEPLNVPRGISYQEATGLARQALIEAY